MAHPNLRRFRTVMDAALAELEARREEINDLNVFPVADGDTGDNMALTLHAVVEELDRLEREERDEGRSIDDIGRDEIVDSVARAALLGARGNSGVILSQLIRGAAEELISRPGELVDPVLVGAAMARAVDRAYASVRDPVEGTILTVMREMAHRVASDVAHMPAPRLDGDAPAEQQNQVLAEVLGWALETGEQSVDRSPDLLDVLRDAGVVDAGGHALTIMLRGVIVALGDAEPPPIEHHHPPARPSHPQHLSTTYRYCTNFAVTGTDLDGTRHVRALEDLGDSVLVVGDGSTLKVHVHTDDPESATGLFDGAGEVSHLDVADMQEQMEARTERLGGRNGGRDGDLAAPEARCGALAVVAGQGMGELYRSLGVCWIDAGPKFNPSTYDLLAGIHSVPAEEVVVLPNSPNVFMAAERAAELSDRPVRVVRSRSPQAGLAAAVALTPGRGAEANAAALEEVLGQVRTGAVAEAARDDNQGRFRRGQAVGFVGEDIVAWGEPEPTLHGVLRALAPDAELLTCIAGQSPPLSDDRVRALAPDGVELEVSPGGQPSWWWLLSAE